VTPPQYTIIVPTYNAAPTLKPLLDSILAQERGGWEVVVVDDGSTDDTAEVVAAVPGVRYEAMAANGGPAAARNLGAALSDAPWLVFTDADTEWYPDTLPQLDAVLAAHPEVDAVVGSYAGRQANPGFVPRWKALWEYALFDMRYQAHADGIVPLNTWAPRPGAVRRAAFEAVGGFDTGFKGADLEDMEFGYRLHEAGYRIVAAPAVACRHHYPATARKELKAFARRAALWMGMMRRRKRFDAAGEGSPLQAVGHLAGFGAFILLPTVILWPWAVVVVAAAFAVYAAAHGAFLRLALREEGPAFAAAALGYAWLHTIVLGFAAGYGLLTSAAGAATGKS